MGVPDYQSLMRPVLAALSDGVLRTSKQLRDQWQRYIRGWWNYFRFADWQREVTDLSGWIRRHMRKCFWLRWKTPRGRINALRRLGVRARALGNAYCRRGAWPMARHVVLQQALKIRTLNHYGLSLPWEVAPAPVADGGTGTGFNRRMRKTARPVVWKGHGAQSP